MIARHRLTLASFDAVARGRPDRAGLAVLDAGQYSKQLLLLRLVADELSATATHSGMTGTESLALLAQAQRRDRRAVRDVLTYPYVSAGFIRSLRGLRDGHGARAATGFLAAVSAVAAVRAGIDGDLPLPVAADPAIHLPGVGTVRATTAGRSLAIRHHSGQATIGGVALPPHLDGDSPGWTALRRLRGPGAGSAPGAAFAPVLDDLDPYRDLGWLPAQPRLPADRFFNVWQEQFRRAWQLLCERHPQWSWTISQVQRAMTPLRVITARQGRSATAWHAYGALALTDPGDHLSLAATLVHETQHSLLNAMFDLFTLYDPADTSLHYTPWRADPRPVRGLLHGCYAFLGVADFWAGERDGQQSRRADYQFARTILQVRSGLDALSSVASLPPDGRRFVAGMARGAQDLADAAPANASSEIAVLANEEHRISWRLHTLVPDPTVVDAATRAWRAGRPAPHLPDTARLSSAPETFVASDRSRGWSHLAVTGEHLSTNAGCPGECVPRDARTADRLMAHGAFGTAVRYYRAAVLTAPENLDSWIGLALAGARQAGAAAIAWRCRPELVTALHRALASGGGEPPDPLTLAGWLSTALVG